LIQQFIKYVTYVPLMMKSHSLVRLIEVTGADKKIWVG